MDSPLRSEGRNSALRRLVLLLRSGETPTTAEWLGASEEDPDAASALFLEGGRSEAELLLLQVLSVGRTGWSGRPSYTLSELLEIEFGALLRPFVEAIAILGYAVHAEAWSRGHLVKRGRPETGWPMRFPTLRALLAASAHDLAGRQAADSRTASLGGLAHVGVRIFPGSLGMYQEVEDTLASVRDLVEGRCGLSSPPMPATVRLAALQGLISPNMRGPEQKYSSAVLLAALRRHPFPENSQMEAAELDPD